MYPMLEPTSMPNTQQESKSKKFQIMPQTKVAFIGYLLILISMIIFMIQNPSLISTFIPALIAYVILYMFALYVINCTVTGNCNLLAWIYAYVVLVIAVLAILALIMKLWKN